MSGCSGGVGERWLNVARSGRASFSLLIPFFLSFFFFKEFAEVF